MDISLYALGRFFPLDNVEALSYPAQIYTSAVSADFAAYAAGAQLIRHGGVGLKSELHGAALAASVEFPAVRLGVDVSCGGEELVVGSSSRAWELMTGMDEKG